MRVRIRSALGVAGAIAASLAALVSVAGAQSPAPALDPEHARATMQNLCTRCHDLGLVASARHDRAGWQEIIGRMYGFGLVASDEEVKEVVDYLTATQPPSS